MRFRINAPPSLLRAAAVGVAAVGLCVTAGCVADAESGFNGLDHTDSGRSAQRPGVIVDSAQSVEEELRRFRADIPERPIALATPSRSRDDLVRSFAQAASRRDTTTLRALHISRDEFAYFYYPYSEFVSDPYRLPPGLVWFQIIGGSGKGLNKAVEVLGTPGVQYQGYECGAQAKSYGAGLLWQNCVTRWVDAAGSPQSARLFGSILELAGRFKFVSYSSGL